MSRTDQYLRILKVIKRIKDLSIIHSWSQDDLGVCLAVLGENSPLFLHYLFALTIQTQGNESQKKKYLKEALDWKILGCYAQTVRIQRGGIRGEKMME